MSASLDDRVIGHGHHATMLEGTSVKIGWIVMVATYEHYPVVALGQAFGIAPCHVLVIPRLFETEATITGYNQQCILHLILHTDFEYKLIEVAMDVARHYNALGGREFHMHLSLILSSTCGILNPLTHSVG